RDHAAPFAAAGDRYARSADCDTLAGLLGTRVRGHDGAGESVDPLGTARERTEGGGDSALHLLHGQECADQTRTRGQHLMSVAPDRIAHLAAHRDSIADAALTGSHIRAAAVHNKCAQTSTADVPSTDGDRTSAKAIRREYRGGGAHVVRVDDADVEPALDLDAGGGRSG